MLFNFSVHNSLDTGLNSGHFLVFVVCVDYAGQNINYGLYVLRARKNPMGSCNGRTVFVFLD